MDREEYPATMDSGAATATACFPEEAMADPAQHDKVEPDNVQEETAAAPAAPQAVSGDDACAEIEPVQVIEALLFASDAPLSAGRLAELSGIGSVKEVRKHIDSLNDRYADAGLSFRIETIAKGYQMLSLAAYQPWLAKLDKHRGQTRLTGAALETLSIVAYKQPVIRADIEAIRGVGCGEVLNRLREMGLIKIVGRAEIVGRPMLYGTTRKFLDIFGLEDLDDLPPMETLNLRQRTEVEPQRTEDDQAPPDQMAAAGA